MTGAGWIDRGPRSGWLFIRLRDGDIRTHNLHLYATDDPAWDDQLAFRDALRADPALRDAYAALKRDIARRSGWARTGYAEAKTGFVRAVLDAKRGGPKTAP